MSDNIFRVRSLRATVALLLCLLLGAVALAACGGDDDDASGGTRVIKTAKGDVTVPTAPKRIVSLAAGVTGNLYTVDARVVATDTRLLGVTNADGGFPPAWAAKAKAQGTTELPAGTELNLDAVAKARPDLIIGGGQGMSAVQADEAYGELSKIAPTVLISSTVTDWREQLRQAADAVGKADKVAPLLQAYQDKVAAVKGAITVPGLPVAYFMSYSNNKPYFVPQTAALPELLAAVGFTPDDVVKKANNPKMFGSGDSFSVSEELLSRVGDAPVMFVVPMGGRPLAQLKADPLFARLPAVQSGKAYELPATSFRPDYDGVMSTLELVRTTFAR